MKIQVWQDYVTSDGTTKIVFYEDRPDGIYIHNFYTRTIKKLDDGFQIPDDDVLKIPGLLTAKVFEAFAEMLDKRGVKTENDHKIAGTLEATRFHLRDLREMLKLKELP